MRNSGAKVVIEGCGSNGCEYMTGGQAVILGSIGDNFGAGMTGGMAWLYDPAGDAEVRLNMETLVVGPVASVHWSRVLEELIETHLAETGSPLAADILRNWDEALPRFLQVCPKEMVRRLEHPLSDAAQAVPAE